MSWVTHDQRAGGWERDPWLSSTDAAAQRDKDVP